MPTPFIRKRAKQAGISVEEAESKWEQAKAITVKKFGKKDWAYTTGIFKRMTAGYPAPLEPTVSPDFLPTTIPIHAAKNNLPPLFNSFVLNVSMLTGRPFYGLWIDEFMLRSYLKKLQGPAGDDLIIGNFKDAYNRAYGKFYSAEAAGLAEGWTKLEHVQNSSVPRFDQHPNIRHTWTVSVLADQLKNPQLRRLLSGIMNYLAALVPNGVHTYVVDMYTRNDEDGSVSLAYSRPSKTVPAFTLSLNRYPMARRVKTVGLVKACVDPVAIREIYAKAPWLRHLAIRQFLTKRREYMSTPKPVPEYAAPRDAIKRKARKHRIAGNKP